jgi:membrane protein
MSAAQVWRVVKQAASEWSEDRALRLAAALACYTILSLAPLLVITTKIATWTLHDNAANGQIQRQLTQLIGYKAADAISAIINNPNTQKSGGWATLVSFLILLFSASGVFAELQDSLNTVWEVKPRPDLSWWDTVKKRFLSIGMVFAIIFLLLVSMFITAALGGVVHNLFAGDAQKGVLATAASYVVDFLVTVLVVGVLFTLMFKYLPDVEVRFRDLWRGGLVTAVLFKIGQYLLAAYFYFGSPTSAYGAVGSIVAVLLWAYYSAAILFDGAEFTQVYAKTYGHRIVPDKDAVPVTDEERAQHGMPRQGDLALAAAAQGQLAGQRGGIPPWATPAGAQAAGIVPKPRVVTITRPTVESNRAYALAGLGLAAGFVVGAVGLFTGRKYTAAGLRQINLNERLDEIESKYGRGRQLERHAIETHVRERLDAMEQRVRHASDAIERRARKQAYHRPRWLQKLDEMVSRAS